MESIPEPIAEGRVAEIFPYDDRRVLKLSRDWVPADWLEYEYAIARIVHGTGMRAPEPFELVSVDGRTGIIYERIEGRPMLSEIASAPQKAAWFGRLMGETHAGMHTRTGVSGLPDNLDILRRKIESVRGAPEEIKAAALKKVDTLPTGETLPGGQRLLHGDFHPGNILMSGSETVVIDWPDASRGHPLGDVARTVVIANLGGLPKNKILRALVGLLRNRLLKAYTRAYFRSSPLDQDALQDWIFPVLFARLSEDIDSEREQSIQWLQKLSEKML